MRVYMERSQRATWGSQEFTASMLLVLVVWVLVLMAVSRMFLRYFIVHNQS